MLRVNDVEGLYLGVRGENRARTIQIDVSAWMVGHPNGSVCILHKRAGATNKEMTGATFDTRTGIVTWEPTNIDTYNAGTGIAEIRLTENGVVKKSRDIPTGTSQSMIGGAGQTLESDWEAYLQDMENKKQAAIQARKDAEAWANGTRDGVEIDEDDPAYEKNSRFYMEQASGAVHAEITAERWAQGTRNGVPVGSTDPTYQNNAKWHAQKAAEDKAYVQEMAGTITRAEQAAIAAESAAATAQAAVQIVGSAFDPDRVGGYKEGEYCLNNGKTYRFTSDHSGAWDAGDVTETGIDEELGGINLGGSVNAFRHLGFYKDSDGDLCQED